MVNPENIITMLNKSLDSANAKMEKITDHINRYKTLSQGDLLVDVYTLLTEYSFAKVSPEYKEVLDDRAESLLSDIAEIIGTEAATQAVQDINTHTFEEGANNGTN